MLDRLLGAFMIGTFLNLALWGVNLGQMSTYMMSEFNDRKVLGWIIWSVFLLGNVHSALSCFTVYDQTVTHFGDLAWNTDAVPWSFCVDPLLTAIIALEVQAFYSYRIYVLSGRRNIWLPILVGVLTLTQLVFGMICTGLAFHHPQYSAVATYDWAVGAWLFAMVAGDLTLTGGIVFFLNSAKQDQEATNSVLDRIIESTVRNNALTAATSIVSAALFVWGVGAWHVIAGLIISKLYQVSFMASLNARTQLAHELRAHRATAPVPSPNLASGGALQVNVVKGSQSDGLGRRPSFVRGKSHDHLHLPSLSALSFGSHHSTLSRSRSREPGLDSIPIHVTVEQTSSEFVVEAPATWAKNDRHFRSEPMSAFPAAEGGLPTVAALGPFQTTVEEEADDDSEKV